MTWIPDCPTFRRDRSKDGKIRFYLFASHPVDIEIMLDHMGLMRHAIHFQDDQYIKAYFRIIRKEEEKIVKQFFP